MSPVESKHCLATPTEIRALTRKVLDAHITGDESRAWYLKALVAKTLALIDTAGRRKATSAEQLAALEAAHKEYYKDVMAAVRERIGPGKPPILNTKGKPYTVNSASNFARSSLATLVAWIRLGNNITRLTPATVTKSAITKEVKQQRQPSLTIVANRALKAGKKMLAEVDELSASDKQAALKTIDEFIAELEAKRHECGGRKIRTGISSGRGLHIPA